LTLVAVIPRARIPAERDVYGLHFRGRYPLGQRLFAAANEPKQFVRIEGGDHNDPQPDSYYEVLAAFLDGDLHAAAK